jgi:PIN domain nuclease of toxin-antitoxin system
VGHRFLSIEPAHARFAGALPAVHGDLFDRMLIAQATLNGLTLLTVDEKIRAYPVETI